MPERGKRPGPGRGNHTGKTCGAKTRSAGKNGRPCRRPAGWGTSHLGFGACKLHGGTAATHTRKAAMEAAQEEMRRAIGVPVLLRQLDRQTVRDVALAVLNGLDLDLEQQARSRELLAAEIASLQIITAAEAREIELQQQRKPRRRSDQSSAAAPTAEENAALDQLVRKTVVRRRKQPQPKE